MFKLIIFLFLLLFTPLEIFNSRDFIVLKSGKFLTGYSNLAQAHVCDDVLMFDPIEIRAEFEKIEIEQKGEFRIFIKNNYGASIHNVRLIPPENIFGIEIIPSSIDQIMSGQKASFLVKVKIPEEVKPGRYFLIMKVDALEFTVQREVQINIEVKKVEEERREVKKVEEEKPEEAVIEILPEDIPIATSLFPDKIEVEPGQSTEFRVYLRHTHKKSIHNIRLVINEQRFKVNVMPRIIKELKPQEKTYFLVSLTVPPNLKPGDYMLSMELVADELAIPRGIGTTIKVGKVREEITYLYLLIILFILFIIIWQGFKRKKIKYQELSVARK